MSSSYDRSKLCIENSKGLMNDLYDPDTGLEYFKPQVGRAPRGRIGRERQMTKNAGENLYE